MRKKSSLNNPIQARNEKRITLPASSKGRQRQSKMTLPLTLINLFAYALNTVVTFGVGAGLFGDLPDNATLSRKYQTLVTPKGWAFAIWGVIFTAQLIWALFQQLPRQRTATPIQEVGLNYLLVCLAQAGWTFAFANESIPASLFFMVMILLFLGVIVKKLYPLPVSYAWKFPFTIHFGWIAAATAVNTSVVLVWLGLSPSIQFYAGIGSLVVLLITALLALMYDYTVPLVLAWALVGIFFELQNPGDTIVATFSDLQITIIEMGSVAGAALLLVSVVAKGIWDLKRKRTEAVQSPPTDEGQYLRADD